MILSNQLTDSIKLVIDKYMPYVTISKNHQRLHERPWITKGILRSIKTRNMLFKKLCDCNF